MTAKIIIDKGREMPWGFSAMSKRIRPGKGEGDEGKNKREATEELDRTTVDDVRWRWNT